MAGSLAPLAPLLLVPLLVLFSAGSAPADGAKPDEDSRVPTQPQPCAVEDLHAAPKRYQLCLQNNANLLFPSFNESKLLVANLNEVNRLLNAEMHRRRLDTTVATPTAAAIGAMRLRLASVRPFRLTVTYPPQEGTPRLAGRGAGKSVARSSHDTSVTIEGRLAVVNGTVTFSSVRVASVGFTISLFTVAGGGGEETVSMSKTTISESIGMKLDGKVRAFLSLVLWFFHAH